MTDVVAGKKLLLVAINAVPVVVNKMLFTVKIAQIANDSPLHFINIEHYYHQYALFHRHTNLRHHLESQLLPVFGLLRTCSVTKERKG